MIKAAEYNRASRAVAERLGYTEVGKETEAEWLYDHYVDHIIYEKKKNLTNNSWTQNPKFRVCSVYSVVQKNEV